MKTLFICKKNESYGVVGYSTTGKRSGLYNSTRFVADAVGADVIEVVDQNAIDKAITARRPGLVIIEALWVTPAKLQELQRLHPRVSFAVHIHSNAPFLAYEGIATEWLRAYDRLGVQVIVNSEPALHAVEVIAPHAISLHNVYPHASAPMVVTGNLRLHVGCFGAVRPMKNQFAQAIAAIKFARMRGLSLVFHINANRSETGGDPVLKNIRALFADPANGVLVEHGWLEHADFLTLLTTIDIALQVSLSETFNIVTADCVAKGVPVVTSREVSWVDHQCWADPDDVNSIATRMDEVFGNRFLVEANQANLNRYSKSAARHWLAFVRS